MKKKSGKKSKRAIWVIDEDKEWYGPFSSESEAHQEFSKELDGGVEDFKYTLYESLGEFSMTIKPSPPVVTVKPLGTK